MMNFFKLLPKNTPFMLRFMIGFFVLLGLIDLLKNYLQAISLERPFDFIFALKFVSIYSLSWILLSYPIYRAFTSLASKSWPRKAGFQLLLSLIFGAAHVILVSLLFSYTIYNAANSPSFWEFYYQRISSRFFPATVNSVMAYGVVIIILFAFDYYRKYQQKALVALQLESQLAQAELQALKMQLHPHFLFNAHNTISMLVRTGKYNQAITMISGLSDLLRTSLTRDSKQCIPLHEELALLEKYLRIEAIRFEDRLSIKFDIEEGLANALVPNLILQPLVENAFKHGISRCLDGAELLIRVIKDKQSLRMTICNSGPPLHENWRLQKHRGIGLSNTLGRLRQLYQDDFVFQIENCPDGVEVAVEIPFEIKSEQVIEPA